MCPAVSWACPAMSWACPGHVLGMFKSCQRHPATRFCCIFFNFFQFFSIFFSTLFAKNQLCYVKFVNPSPCSELFTWIPFIIFHILATEAPSNPLLMHFSPFFSIFFHFFFFFLQKFFFLFGKLVTFCHVSPFYIGFTLEFSYFGDKTPFQVGSTWNFDTAIYDWNMT